MLMVKTQDGSESFGALYEYRTTEDGELDVFDQQQVVVETFAAGFWKKVSRVKGGDEWPASVLKTATDEESHEPDEELDLGWRPIKIGHGETPTTRDE